MPHSFLGRTILMVLIPLIIALLIVTNAFFGNHWKKVHSTLAADVTADTSSKVQGLPENSGGPSSAGTCEGVY